MLEIGDLKVEYKDFNLSVNLPPLESKIYSVMGPSASGKSTFLAALSGFQSISKGEIFWKRKQITHLHPSKRPIAMLFQENNLFPHLSAERNIGLALKTGFRFSNIDKNKVHSSLERVGLAGCNKKRPAELSGGQQSRVALARVLLQNKPILLLDEPFSALGPALKLEMLDLVQEVARENNTLVLMVTHDPKDALRISEETIVIIDGKANFPKNTIGLFKNPPIALAEYLGDFGFKK